MTKHSSSAVSFDQLQTLITDIYDAALDSHKWIDVLEKLVHTLQAEQAYMRTINTESNEIKLSYSYNKDPDWTQAYKDYYIHKDPWLNNLLKENKTVIACTHHHMSDKDYEALEYHRDLVTPQGIHYGLGGKILIKDKIANYLALNRDRKNNGFENEYLETLKILTPHIQKALLINEKTNDIKLENNFFRDILNQVNSPLLMVNEFGKILFINLLAEDIINQQANLTIKNNHIIILSQEENNKLQSLINQATANNTSLQQGGAMCYTNTANHTSVSILVSPVNPELVNSDIKINNSALLILSANQLQNTFSIERLKGLYNFTPAEARLSMYLCQGLTLEEVSEILSLSKNTLRSQLRSCFYKTGISRQSELIRLVNNGPAGLIR